MLADIGQFLLINGFIIAILLMVLPLLGYYTNNSHVMNTARPLAYILFISLLASFSILVILFVIQDFSVTYVWKHSNTLLPMRYRISAAWSAHEGSILMWVMILSLWVSLVARFSRTLRLNEIARVLSVLGLVSVGFLAFVIFTSNPFERTIPTPVDGFDLNPLLQDIGLILHPPILYMGYIGFSVAFALSLAALMGGDINENWIRWSKKWTNIAWAFLTAGIILGSWWAYYELGWGGWWFWDPVENASFLPWLAATALIHVQSVSERKNAFRGWTILLAIMTFSLSVLGTFLVRSGTLTSVHSFAADPSRGIFLLSLLGIYAGLGFALYALRVDKLKSRQPVNLGSKETFLLINSAIFFASMLTILLGTLTPIIYQAFGKSISVGAPYFGLVFFFLMAPIAILLPIGVVMNWHRGNIFKAIKSLFPLLCAAFIMTILFWYFFKPLNIKAIAGIFAAFWVLLTSLYHWLDQKDKWKLGLIGMHTAHLGFAVFLFGVSMTEHTDYEKDVLMNPGDKQIHDQYEIEFNGVSLIAHENYRANQGEFVIRQNNQVMTTLRPEKRQYPRQENPMTEADIDVSWNKDLYISLGEKLNNSGGWSVRIYIKPYIRWMWGGGLLMLTGALIALFDQRYKKIRKNQYDQRMQEELGLL